MNIEQLIRDRIERAPLSEIITLARTNGQAQPQPPEARFAVRDNMVHDATTGLTWIRGNVNSERLNWKDAEAACAKLSLGGHSDWRLPTIRELLSIVDYERHSPAIDTEVFQCEPAFYWTSTPYAPSPADYAWHVYFSSGSANCSSRDYGGFVRAVRGGQF